MVQRLIKHIATILLTAVLGGMLGATLVRFSPGAGVDEREFDPRLSAESVAALRQQLRTENNLPNFYRHYFAGLLHGDLGFSRTLNRPAAQLIATRFPVTLRQVSIGLLVGWTIAMLLVVPAVMLHSWQFNLLAGGLTSTLLAVPAAVLALMFVFLRAPPSLALALVVVPKIFGYSRNVMLRSYELPHVLAARCKGLGEVRVFLWHVLPVTAPQMLALVAISVTLAIGAAIPVEALCDLPGIGQLAWQAALGRDLVLLVNLTTLVTLITVTINSASDLLGRSMWRGAA